MQRDFAYWRETAKELGEELVETEQASASLRETVSKLDELLEEDCINVMDSGRRTRLLQQGLEPVAGSAMERLENLQAELALAESTQTGLADALARRRQDAIHLKQAIDAFGRAGQMQRVCKHLTTTRWSSNIGHSRNLQT